MPSPLSISRNLDGVSLGVSSVRDVAHCRFAFLPTLPHEFGIDLTRLHLVGYRNKHVDSYLVQQAFRNRHGGCEGD